MQAGRLVKSGNVYMPMLRGLKKDDQSGNTISGSELTKRAANALRALKAQYKPGTGVAGLKADVKALITTAAAIESNAKGKWALTDVAVKAVDTFRADVATAAKQIQANAYKAAGAKAV